MSNTITHEEGNFSTIPNQLLNDSSVSLTAKGLYVFMRGKPPLWNFTIRSMAKQLKEGDTAIGSALNELKDSGWISYTKHSNGKGVYHLFWSANASTENPNQENPNQGNPMKGKPKRISKKEPIVKQIAKEPLSSKPDIAEKVIQYLNDKTGSKFRATPSHTKFIDARIAEGATPQDLIAVINRKCLEWLDDPKFAQYLRPSTLFNAEKFNTYVGQLDTPLPAKGPQKQGHPDIDFNSTGWLRS
ncbi:MAG TPA: conserved phage C-terminal domain-containing protein [Candidatus Saccharibacteria bacterium]|nr:conserved phage C-terminal domain-containing protein [Candidatus Saccharibacteria bacterium]